MAEPASHVVTLKERKARKTAQKIAAAEAVKESLREFVKKTEHRGRFIVFGTAASGVMRYDSDFDVIVDFPPEDEPPAYAPPRMPAEDGISRRMCFLRAGRRTSSSR